MLHGIRTAQAVKPVRPRPAGPNQPPSVAQTMSPRLHASTPRLSRLRSSRGFHAASEPRLPPRRACVMRVRVGP
ncbi:hypothetical protein B296_00051897 [Ensete ventricosum]|uniref:Uncharacterized protein n=1 Tax=Ensete ventricosum TaxID=4639 RepID=A0A426Y3B9_ENSVE|nr:hypothetical protein B296_00051897 [Ensete ventricosum]